MPTTKRVLAVIGGLTLTGLIAGAVAKRLARRLPPEQIRGDVG